MSAALSRRDLLLRGSAFAALGALAGPGAALAQEGEDTSDTDGALLVGMIGFEQQSEVAYAAATASGTLGAETSIARQLAGQQHEHAGLLTAALAEIGGKPKPTPLKEDVPGLTEPTTREEFLRFLVAGENQCLAACLEANKELGSGDLLTLSSRICASHGQHLVVLRQALGTDPLPAPLPSGSERR